MLRLSLLLVASLAMPHGAAACPPPSPPGLVPVTVDGATLVGEGGVVFRQDLGHHNRGNDASPTLREAGTGNKVAGKWLQPAPLLMVLQPPPGHGRDLEVVDASGKVMFAVHQTRAMAAPAAPVLVSATSTTARSKKPPQANVVFGANLTIVLRTPPPPDAIALVVLDDNGWGRMWFAPTEKQTTFTAAFPTSKPCATVMYPVYAGERIALAWLDATGRISPTSRRVSVTRTR